MTSWSAATIPPQHGRTVIITGGNSGIGRAAAEHLVAKGARVVIAVRDLGRGEAAAAEIGKRASEYGTVEVRLLDLADLASVRAFAESWEGSVDVLINNAGIMAVPAGRTVDGFELQFGTNHLGHFALTNLLLPSITDRVVTVSSGAHRMGGLKLDDLNWERRPYSAWRAYGQTKLANLLFTLELQRRLDAAPSSLRAMAAHPGYAATNLQSGTGNRIARAMMAVANKVVAQSDTMGSLPTVFAATQDLPGAAYAGPGGPGESRGLPVLVGRSVDASDPELAKKLWDASEALTGVRFPTLG